RRRLRQRGVARERPDRRGDARGIAPRRRAADRDRSGAGPLRAGDPAGLRPRERARCAERAAAGDPAGRRRRVPGRTDAGAGAVHDGAVERLIGHVRRTVGASGIPRERVRYVEALPGGDFAGYDRLRDLVAEDGFVPFTRFWRGEFSPAAHQVWLTTRFHHHLVAALHGARGIALTAKTGYYDVKHGSLVEGGSRWRVQDGTGEVLDLSQLPDPAPAADSIAAKTAEAQL